MVNIRRSRKFYRRHVKRKSVVPCQNGWTTSNPWVEQEFDPVSRRFYRTQFSLNKDISNLNNIKKLRNLNTRIKYQGFYSCVPSVTIRREPFHIGIIENFIADKNSLLYLYKDMQTLQWNSKKMDLYELSQSPDLSTVSSKHLQNFFKFLQTDVRKWMADITGMKFTRVSATCSMYSATNYLLPHDDLLEDRLIAFILYICPWRLSPAEYYPKVIEGGWSSKMGGNLKLYTVNKLKQPVYPAIDKICPKNNQFVFFKVSRESYHEVEEIYTDDYSRLSINGWFHGPRTEENDNNDERGNDGNDDNKIISSIPKSFAYEIGNDICLLNDYVQSSYLTGKIKKAINNQIEMSSEISLAKFFKDEFYDKVYGSFSLEKCWKRVGPVNKCNYEIAFMKELYDFFYSDSFIRLLKDYTDLDLPVGDSELKKSSIDIEIQRWTSGCYTLLTNKCDWNCDELDVIMYFNCTENSSIGSITYLDPADAEENVLLTIYPKNNTLNIVYRTSGTTKFTKYVNHKMIDSSKYFYIVSCRYREFNKN